MRILVDMDGVLVDIEKGFLTKAAQARPDLKMFDRQSRQSFSLVEAFPEKEREALRQILQEQQFWASLPPIEGAVEAMNEMVADGHDVYIVTSAGVKYPFAASEKYQWVEKHLGRDFLRKLVITPAKYVVKGDVLIDDKPDLKHEDEAEWEHILYDWPYNRNVAGKRRLTWVNWREVLNNAGPREES